jgi:Xaa-Pro dipeptidase
MEAAGLSYVLLVPGPNLYYFAGVRMGLSERITLCCLPAGAEPVFLAPELEAPRIADTAAVRVFAYTDELGPVPALRDLVESTGLSGRVGVEFRSLRLLELALLQSVVDEFSYHDVGPAINRLRVAKNPSEIADMEEAAQWADLAMDAARKAICAGVTERQVERVINQSLQQAGVLAPPGVAVASGPRAAIPHAHTSDRTIGSGETVWVDLVIPCRGYYADITRTFVTGMLEGELDRAYSAVVEAQEAARQEAGPGLSGAQVDAVARGIISRHGFGPNFIHRTGHGLGLEVHEEPYLVASNHARLPVGAVCTVEPGVYLPGLGGIRIEDDIVITPTGARSITTYQRDLRG